MIRNDPRGPPERSFKREYSYAPPSEQIILNYDGEDTPSSSENRSRSVSSHSSSSNRRPRLRTPPSQIDDYIEMLRDYWKIAQKDRHSPILQDPEVLADEHRRKFHWGRDVAEQFNMTFPHVMDMLLHMFDCYDTVTAYSLGMLPPGTIIYYLEPYTLGFDQKTSGGLTAEIGPGGSNTAMVQMKGRFGIVVDRYSQSLKVAESYTFGGRGLAEKQRRIWSEYVGLQLPNSPWVENPSDNPPLEVATTVCNFDPKSSIHLVTNKVSLSSQILIAGRITQEALKGLRNLIKETDGR